MRGEKERTRGSRLLREREREREKERRQKENGEAGLGIKDTVVVKDFKRCSK